MEKRRAYFFHAVTLSQFWARGGGSSVKFQKFLTFPDFWFVPKKLSLMTILTSAYNFFHVFWLSRYKMNQRLSFPMSPPSGCFPKHWSFLTFQSKNLEYLYCLIKTPRFNMLFEYVIIRNSKRQNGQTWSLSLSPPLWMYKKEWIHEICDFTVLVRFTGDSSSTPKMLISHFCW